VRLELIPQGAAWQLNDNVQSWLSALPIQGASALNDYLVDHPELLQQRNLFVPAAVVASWSETAATQLGLPVNCPLAFDVRLSVPWASPVHK
jgi:hypothetical protein